MADFREKILVGQLAACASDMRALTAEVRRVTANNEATLARLAGLERNQTITDNNRFGRS